MLDRFYYILAPNYHGSTLVSRVLSSHGLVCSLGDTYPATTFDQVCGCGKRVSECEFWQKVVQGVGPYRRKGDPTLIPYVPRMRGPGVDQVVYNLLPDSVIRFIDGLDTLSQFNRGYESFLEGVCSYPSYRECQVFVDGVKSISRVRCLAASGHRVDGLICVSRSMRDYLHSSRKTCGRLQQPFNGYKTMLGYLFYYAMRKKVAKPFKSLWVDYEAFCGNWEGERDRMLRFIGLSPVTSDAVARMEEWHFMGNQSLFEFKGVTVAKKYPDDDPEIENLVRKGRILGKLIGVDV